MYVLSEVGRQEDQLSEDLSALGHPGQIRRDNEPQDAHQGRKIDRLYDGLQNRTKNYIFELKERESAVNIFECSDGIV